MKKYFGIVCLVMAMLIGTLPMHAFASQEGQLMYRLAEEDEEDFGFVENKNNPLESSYRNSYNSETAVYFYYVENGEDTLIAPSELVSSDETVLQLADVDDAVVLCAVGVGTATVSYEADGSTYTMDVTVKLPSIELYSEHAANKDALLEEFFLTDTEKTFYVATTDDWKLTEVILDEELAKIAEVEISTDKTYAVITITGIPAVGESLYGIMCSAEDADGTNLEEELALWISTEGPTLEDFGLKYRVIYVEDGVAVEDKENSLWNSYQAEPGNMEYVWFYYVEDGEEIRVEFSDLISSDETIVRLSEDASGAVIMEAVECGQATIDYVKDGVTYSVYVDVEVYEEMQTPDVLFSVDGTMEEGMCIEEFTVTDTENSFYLITNNGWIFTEVVLSEEFAKIAEAAISEDGTYAVITVTGVPEDGCTYDVEYEVSDSDGGIMGSSASITLNNAKENVPSTGDTASVWMWTTMLALGCVMMGVAISGLKKKI